MRDTDIGETTGRPPADRDGVMRAVIEGTTDAVFVKDPGGRYLLVNSACARFIGRPPEEIVGRLDTDLYPPDTARQFMEADREVLASGETRVFEGVAHGAGGRADYRVTKGVVRDRAGRAVALFGISHDITDRRAAEEERARRIREQAAREEAEASGRAKDDLLRALRESEDRYRAFIANSSEGIWRFEFERPVPVALTEDEQIEVFYETCHLAECNDAAARMYGFDRAEEMVGARLADFLVRADPANVEYLRAFIRSGYKLADAESVEVDREGRTRHFLNSLAGTVEGGQLVRVWGTQRDVTERKRAEDALREGEERLRLALNAGQVGTWDWDVLANRVTWSERVYELHGLKPGEFGGSVEEFAARVHEEDRARVREAIERALATGEPYTAEMRVVRPDGRVRWVFTNGQAIFEAGRAVRMLGATVDVTERREAEGKLRTLVNASESLLGSPRTEAVLSAALKLAGRLVRADAYAIWRYRDGEAARWEVVSSEGLSDEYRDAWIAVNSETPSMPETPVVVEDVEALSLLAERRDFYRREGFHSLLVLPLKIHGQVAGTLAFYYREPRRFAEADVTVATAIANLSASAIGTAELYEEQSRLRREAESASRRSAFRAEAAAVLTSSLDYERTLQAVARLAVPHIADWCAVDIVGDGGEVRRLAVAHVDPAKVEWARELADRYPYDPAAPTGVPNVIRTGRSEVYPEIPDEMLAAAAKDEEHLRILRELGFTSALIVPMAAHGRVAGAITFVTAESGRHYGAEDLALAEHLARRAALAVENARLYREAQEANRIKDEFLATLSHELRTPLTAILGWASMLRTNRFDEESTRRAVETIERNARAQRQIVEDVLDVSRIITGRLRIDARPVEVRSLVEAAVDGVRPAAEAKGVFLSTMLGRDAGVISADPDRLQQVMWNLLSNAVKFTPAGGRVEVELRRVDQQAVVVVRDTGQGIRPEFLPHVFDRFRQADQSTTRRHGGLGLGLAIVRHLVELHGGTVTAESEGEGRGSSFTVRLPLKAVTQPAEARFEGAGVPPPVEQDGPTPGLPGTRVLLVEDDDDARALLRNILEGRGARVTAVASAAEAWAALEGGAHDVLVSDIGMPDEDGYSLVRRLREREAGGGGGRLPAVALTAYARDEDRTRALLTGFHAHVAKPVNPAELVAVVASLAALASGRPDVS